MTTSPPHETEWGVVESLSISLPPGPLGVAIQKRSSLDDDPHRCRFRDDDVIGGLTGRCCVVSSKSDPTSPLEVNDVILSLNGIALGEVTGGVGAWVTLFGAFVVRNVVVLRRRRVSATLSEVGLVAAEARAPHPPLLASANKKRKSVAEAEEWVERGIIDTAGAAADAASKEKRLDKTKEKALRGGHKKKIPKSTRERNGSGDDDNDDDDDDPFVHDDDYMRMMMSDGFPGRGRVSSCHKYYVTKNSESYKDIAMRIGLDKNWKALSEVEFNKRFYGAIVRGKTFKGGTVVKIPTHLVSRISTEEEGWWGVFSFPIILVLLPPLIRHFLLYTGTVLQVENEQACRQSHRGGRDDGHVFQMFEGG